MTSRELNPILKTSSNHNPVIKSTVPNYYTVSTIRFVLLSLITGSIYVVYWSYKNWIAIELTNPVDKNGKKVKIYPKLSSFFYAITSYDLFNRVRQASTSIDNKKPVNAGLCAWGVFLLNFLFLAFIPVLSIQNHMNDIKLTAFGDKQLHQGTSPGEIIFIIIAIILFGARLTGTYNSNNSANSNTISDEAKTQQQRSDQLKSEYDKCLSATQNSRSSVDTNDQASIDNFNNSLQNCENTRLQLNDSIDKYNTLIKQ